MFKIMQAEVKLLFFLFPDFSRVRWLLSRSRIKGIAQSESQEVKCLSVPPTEALRSPLKGTSWATQGHSSCNLKQEMFSVLCLPLYKNVRRRKAIAIFYMPTICQALPSRFIFMISFLSLIRTLQSRLFFFQIRKLGNRLWIIHSRSVLWGLRSSPYTLQSSLPRSYQGSRRW